MLIRMATASDLGGWVELRAELWFDTSFDKHQGGAEALLAKPIGDAVVLVGVDRTESVCAFAEAALRHDYVNGCETSPVAFLEGIYVRPENRRSGLGKGLFMAVQTWAREQGCKKIASDAPMENTESQVFHVSIGFEETERVVYFQRLL